MDSYTTRNGYHVVAAENGLDVFEGDSLACHLDTTFDEYKGEDGAVNEAALECDIILEITLC